MATVFRRRSCKGCPQAGRICVGLVVAAVVSGCDDRLDFGDQQSSVRPHQDEWWPHHDRDIDNLVEQRHRLRTALLSGALTDRDRSVVAYDLSACLWLLDESDEALQIAEQVDPAHVPQAEVLRGAILRRLDRIDDARVLYAESRSRLRTIEDNPFYELAVSNAAWLELQAWMAPTGEVAAGTPDRVLAILDATPQSVTGLLNRAGTQLLVGDLSAAGDSLRRCETLVQGPEEDDPRWPSPAVERTWWALRGELAMRQQRWKDAEGFLHRAILVTRGSDQDVIEDPYLEMVHGICLSEIGRYLQADEGFQRAFTGFSGAARTLKISGERRERLLEQARRTCLHRAVARFRSGTQRRELQDTLDGWLDEIGQWGGDGSWYELLGLMLAGERPINRVRRSVPQDLSPSQHVDARTQVLLAAAQRYEILGRLDDAIECLEQMPEPIAGTDGIERAVALAMHARLRAGEPGQ